MRAVGALILAAGESARLGQPKQLVRFDGQSLVRRSVRAATDAGCVPVCVVVGNLRRAIEAELNGIAVTIVENREWSLGLGTSIRSGLESLLIAEPAVSGVVLLTCDQPKVSSVTIRNLLDEQRQSGKSIVASTYAGTLGVPVLFDASCFDLLLTLPNESGAKPLIEARLGEVAAVVFEAGGIDIDTPDDLDRLRRGTS